MAKDYILGRLHANGSQGYGLVGCVMDQPFFEEGAQCLGYRGPADLEAACYIFTSGNLVFGNDMINGLNIVF